VALVAILPGVYAQAMRPHLFGHDVAIGAKIGLVRGFDSHAGDAEDKQARHKSRQKSKKRCAARTLVFRHSSFLLTVELQYK
jgi:hypothetical protein